MNMLDVSGSDLGPISADKFLAKILSGEFGKPLSAAAADTARAARDAAFNAKYPNFESRNLSRKQVRAIFERVAKLNNRMLSEGRLEEGIWDDIKSGAGKGLQGVKNLAGKAVGAVAQGAAKVGRSMTANVSSDALTKAWQAAGSPTDSAEIEKLLQAQGVNPEVIKTVFQANKIPVTPTAPVGQDTANDPTVDAANEPMPDVMTPGGNRPEQGAMAQGVQQAQDGQQQPPASPVPAAGATPQQAQGGQQQPQQAQGGQQSGAADANVPRAKVDATTKMIELVPIIARLTPAQKTQLLAQIDQRLAAMPAPTQQAQPQADAAPVATPASTVSTPEPAQQAVADNTPKIPKPKVPYSSIQKQTQPDVPIGKVSSQPKPGAPTPQEYAKFQDKLRQALQQQGQQ
jgi:hypothetical protein